DIWPDLHMWRKFLRLPGISAGTRMTIQSLAVQNVHRRAMTPEERARENQRWFERIADEAGRETIRTAAWTSLVREAERHQRDAVRATVAHAACADELGRMTASRDEIQRELGPMTASRDESRTELDRMIAARDELQGELGRMTVARDEFRAQRDHVI